MTLAAAWASYRERAMPVEVVPMSTEQEAKGRTRADAEEADAAIMVIGHQDLSFQHVATLRVRDGQARTEPLPVSGRSPGSPGGKGPADRPNP
jgi:hypothetical protein